QLEARLGQELADTAALGAEHEYDGSGHQAGDDGEAAQLRGPLAQLRRAGRIAEPEPDEQPAEHQQRRERVLDHVAATGRGLCRIDLAVQVAVAVLTVAARGPGGRARDAGIVARQERLEPPTCGFGDRCSANRATGVRVNLDLALDGKGGPGFRPALALSGEPVAGSPQGAYFRILATTPAPTVRPPSRIAKRRPSSIATGLISDTDIFPLSPGITISTPSASWTAPLLPVVRK